MAEAAVGAAEPPASNARRAPALKAVVALCASADRYGADVKYHGGCVLGCELLPWSSTMLAMSVRPPDPNLVGEGWRELCLERLEEAVPFAETWLAHQRRDEYWHTGSPCDDYGRIECPVYAVGGWAARGRVSDPAGPVRGRGMGAGLELRRPDRRRSAQGRSRKRSRAETTVGPETASRDLPEPLIRHARQPQAAAV